MPHADPEPQLCLVNSPAKTAALRSTSMTKMSSIESLRLLPASASTRQNKLQATVVEQQAFILDEYSEPGCIFVRFMFMRIASSSG